MEKGVRSYLERERFCARNFKLSDFLLRSCCLGRTMNLSLFARNARECDSRSPVIKLSTLCSKYKSAGILSSCSNHWFHSVVNMVCALTMRMFLRCESFMMKFRGLMIESSDTD